MQTFMIFREGGCQIKIFYVEVAGNYYITFGVIAFGLFTHTERLLKKYNNEII